MFIKFVPFVEGFDWLFVPPNQRGFTLRSDEHIIRFWYL